MATYEELATIQEQAGFGTLQAKLRAAVTIKAVSYLEAATPTMAQVTWAQATIRDPASAASNVQWYVIGANSGATVSQILTASDSAVQTNVNTAVDAITDGGS